MISNQSNGNPFGKYMKDIFNNIYLANVYNRLRELENPSNNDCKRWIWELIQNAKDSIVGQKDKKTVDIEINVQKDIYKFKHNGSPFTMKNLTRLLYKYSDGKTKNSESTGRFGTGFLTTHSLSKIVTISSDVIDDNDNLKYGFTLTMYREGEKDELLEGLKKTENSYKRLSDPLGWTTYEYVAKTERNKEAGRLGIQNLKENIAFVMLFCPEINTIKLNDNNKLFTIERNIEFKEEINKFQILSFKIKDDDKNLIKKILYYKIDEYNEQLTEKFDKKRNLRLCLAIEIDENDNIVSNKSLPSLFCSFPLVGSETHELPFYINSLDFEPDSERPALLLDGDEKNEKTGKISEPGINKMILLRAAEIYKGLLNYIEQINLKKRYLLIRGLCHIPYINKFDSKWYEGKFLPLMRNILLESPIILSGNAYKKLTEINIPVINLYDDEENKKIAYNFISKLYDNKVPVYDESIIIENVIWMNDSKINFKKIENCVEILQNLGNIENVKNKIDENDIWKWINDFLQFILKLHREYLEK